MRPRVWILTLSLAAAAAAVPLLAAPPAESATPATPSSATASPAATTERKVVKVVKIGQQEAPALRGLVAVRDAETGQLRAPNAEEWSRLSVSLDPLYRTDIGLEEMYYEDGTVGVRLGDRYHSMALAHRSAAGKLVPSCTHDVQTAADAITGNQTESAVEARNDQ